MTSTVKELADVVMRVADDRRMPLSEEQYIALKAVATKLVEMEDALTPFAISEHNARLAGNLIPESIEAPHWMMPRITYGDLRRAARALQSKEPGQ